MRLRALRTFGASLVLLVIAGLAVNQLATAPRDGDAQVAVDPVASPPASEAPATDDSTAAFTYRVGILSGVSTDNFWAFYGGEASVWNAYVLGPTKPALFTVDPSSGTLVPEVAATAPEPELQGDRWEISVPLDDEFHWSDGTPVTADDVVFTFDTVRRLRLGGSWAAAFPDSVASISATSPYELEITFTERPTLAVWPHAVGLAPIMSSDAWATIADGATAEDLFASPGARDLGGGPLVIDFISEDLIVSVSNPGYPSAGGPDSVEYTVYESETGAVEALGLGQIDTILSPHGLTAANAQLARSYRSVGLSTSPANSVRYLGFNLTKEPMSEPAFRTALAILLDRDQLAEGISGSTPAYTFVSPGNRQWFDGQAQKAITTMFAGEPKDRVAKALDLLIGAGYGWETRPRINKAGVMRNGEGLTINGTAPAPLTILTPGDAYDPERPRYAAEIAEVLEWLGFDAVPLETDFDSVVDLAFSPGDDGNWLYDMYLLGWTLGSPALPDYYRPLFSSQGLLNNTGYDSEAFDEQLARYEAAYTYDDAFRALWEMELILATDLPYLLLYTNPIEEAYRSDRVAYAETGGLGGLQGRLGGVGDVTPVG